jgi:hypothetical protein
LSSPWRKGDVKELLQMQISLAVTTLSSFWLNSLILFPKILLHKDRSYVTSLWKTCNRNNRGSPKRCARSTVDRRLLPTHLMRLLSISFSLLLMLKYIKALCIYQEKTRKTEHYISLI